MRDDQPECANIIVTLQDPVSRELSNLAVLHLRRGDSWWHALRNVNPVSIPVPLTSPWLLLPTPLLLLLLLLHPPASGAPWPIVLAISLQQGRAIKSVLAPGGPVAATVGFAGPPDIALTTIDYLPSAAAVVAGVAGLLWSAHPACSGAQMRQALEATARQMEGPQGTRNDKFGWGIVQAAAAEAYLLENPCTPFNPELAVSAPRPTGPSVIVTVKLMFPPSVAHPPPIFTVANKTIIVTSTPTDTIDCGNTTTTTDATGTAQVTCQVLRNGPATVTATAPPSFGFNAVTRSIRFF
jgi:hypothetical protein